MPRKKKELPPRERLKKLLKEEALDPMRRLVQMIKDPASDLTDTRRASLLLELMEFDVPKAKSAEADGVVKSGGFAVNIVQFSNRAGEAQTVHRVLMAEPVPAAVIETPAALPEKPVESEKDRDARRATEKQEDIETAKRLRGGAP